MSKLPTPPPRLRLLATRYLQLRAAKGAASPADRPEAERRRAAVAEAMAMMFDEPGAPISLVWDGHYFRLNADRELVVEPLRRSCKATGYRGLTAMRMPGFAEVA